MTDPALMRGEGWIRCCLCGNLHTDPYPDLYIDEVGRKWDVCLSCHAYEAGLADDGV